MASGEAYRGSGTWSWKTRQYHNRCNQSDHFEIGEGGCWRDNQRSTLVERLGLVSCSKKSHNQRRALIAVAPEV